MQTGCLLLALTTDNIHLVDDELMSAMKAGLASLMLPVALDQRVVISETLTTGHLQGAGLDVFETEPFSSQNPLPNCQMSYLGVTVAHTKQAIHRVNALTVKMALEFITAGSLNKLQSCQLIKNKSTKQNTS